MEEEIRILEKLEFIAYGKKEDIEALGMNINVEKLDTTKIIRNLINKYKEQERDIRASHILLAKYSQKNEEQEKTIQLMSEELAELNYEYCGIWCEGKKCKEYYENHFINEESCNGNKLTCIIDYFKKKARTSNDK